jgi:hypothetical protein
MTTSPFGNIKLALDTNILSYLLDGTYPNLNKFIKYLNESGLVDLFCSQFVIYELIEIRKLEHYIRKIHAKTTAGGTQMNFSSVLKYRKDWSAPELDYGEICDDIMTLVENNVQQIYDDYGIEYNDASIHRGLWEPHQKLVLTSKISKEDSLVLLSSVFPDIGIIEKDVIFFTNDDKFYRAYTGTGKDKIEKLEEVFTSNNIPSPTVMKISDIICPISKTKFNIINDNKSEDEIKQYVKDFIFEHFQLKNLLSYLGKISKNGCGNNYMMCFKLDQEKELNENIYLSILTKDLMVINIPKALKSFWSGGSIIKNYPFRIKSSIINSENISVSLKDENNNPIVSREIYDAIMTNGNLIFTHPDI